MFGLLERRFVIGLTGVAALGAAATLAQQIVAPPIPDPTHISFTLPKDIKWEGDPLHGQQQAKLFGDPAKPGLYGILIKWLPGHYSRPHFHNTDRYALVISGTWWVSSSDVYDLKTLYPMPAGTFVTDIANTVHWDGARDEPAILELVGMGPVVTTPAEKR
jgi:hypothetical protein